MQSISRYFLDPNPFSKRDFKRDVVFWFFVALLWFWWGAGNHGLWDRDEPRYAVATAEMLRTGDWIVPMLNGRVRYDKPVLIYWLMAMPMAVLGPTEFAARFWSGIGGALQGVIILGFARSLGFAKGAARLCALLLVGCFLTNLVSRASTIDGVLIPLITALVWLFWRIRTSEKYPWGLVLLFWAGFAAAVLLKGPPAPMVLGSLWFSLALFGRRQVSYSGIWSLSGIPPRVRIAGTLMGFAVFLLLALPWAVAVSVATGGEFLDVSIGRHVVERSSSAMDGHAGPIFYYIPALFLNLLPFTPIGLVGLAWAWKNRRDPLCLFLLCWLLPTFLILSVVKTKLPHYLGPAIPAVVLMAGAWWNHRLLNPLPREAFRRTRIGGAILIFLLGAGVLGFAAYIPWKYYELGAAVVFLAFVTLLLLGVSLVSGGIFWLRQRTIAALAFWTLGWVTFVVILIHVTLPSIEPLRPSKNLIQVIRSRTPADTQILLDRWKEQSLYFYAQDYVTFVPHNAPGALEMLDTPGRSRVLIVPRREWDHWMTKLKNPVDEAEYLLHEERYFEPNKGRWITLMVLWNGWTHQSTE